MRYRGAFLWLACGIACGEPDVTVTDAGSGGMDAAITSCEPPRELCAGACSNTQTDPFNCGDCGNECLPSSFCSAGLCSRLCSTGMTACGASCVDISADREHCGGCNAPCAMDRDCRGGSCRCPDGYTECNGACINPGGDPLNCGICGRHCEADEICSAGSCVCAGGARETDCLDGRDNDCDDLRDCRDPDCTGTTRTCMGACGEGVETCEASGSYGVCVGGDGSAEICGDGIDQDCNGSDLRSPDLWEPNDTCATCMMLAEVNPNVYLNARFDSLDDPVDCYKFSGDDTASYPEHIRITLEEIPAGNDYDVYLYKSEADCDARMPLASSEALSNANEMIDWSENFGSADDATYFVRVVRFAGQSCTDDYRLTVNGLR